jgi:membrane protein DedA with SNARE-associated domain/rhodanese-related sulfurtransferase
VGAIIDLVLRYGYLALFSYLLLAQLGPFPSTPLMLAAGALGTTHRLSFAPTVAAVLAASLCADSLWYSLGRARGAWVVRLLCRISLEPQACARMADGAIRRHGPRFLLIAKFLPGVGLMVPPVVGQAQVPYGRFLGFDAAGASLWAVTYVGLGRFLGEAMGRSAQLPHLTARLGVVLVGAGVLVAVLARLVRRRRYRRTHAQVARIGAAELRRRIDDGETPCLVDLRDPAQGGDARLSLPGAIRLRPADVLAHTASFPGNRDVVLFCDCPADAGSIDMAAKLRKLGVERALALEGGLRGWTRAGYPLVEIDPRLASDDLDGKHRPEGWRDRIER